MGRGKIVPRIALKMQALALLSLWALAGCASMPDLNRLQSNMDQMVQYMGIMATSMPIMVNSTARMADSADRMEKKADGMIAQLTKRAEGTVTELRSKSASAERAIQNYTQAILDNERAMIKNLQGIRTELKELKLGLGKAGDPAADAAQARINAALQAKLNDLDERLKTLSTLYKQREGMGLPAR